MIVKALSLSLSRFLAGFWINKLQGSKGPKLKHLPVKALSLSLSRFCLKVKPFHFHFHKTPKGESRRLDIVIVLKGLLLRGEDSWQNALAVKPKMLCSRLLQFGNQVSRPAALSVSSAILFLLSPKLNNRRAL